MLTFNNNKMLYLVLMMVATLASCTPTSHEAQPPRIKENAQPSQPLQPPQAKSVAAAAYIRSYYKAHEITDLCEKSLAQAKNKLDQIASLKNEERNSDNTLLAFENAIADLNDQTTPLTFMGYVSTNSDMSAEGAACETDVGQFNVAVYTRRDIYKALTQIKARNKNETRLLEKTIESFEQNGLKLSDEVLAQVKSLKEKLTAHETQFSTNLNNDKTVVLFKPEKLVGLPSDYLANLKKNNNGQVIINTKESDFPVVMQNAKLSETRHKMMQGYLSRGGDDNTRLLTESVSLRAQISHLMGYANWADYRTHGRMAQNGKQVLDFLNGLKDKLAQRNQADMSKILNFKKEQIPDSKKLDQWDISYYSYQLKKRDFSLDNEKIREYFPADVVIAGMFQVYSKMLGVRYEEISDVKNWAVDVKLYAIHNSSDGQIIGYFYTDFFPREGKYDHAAAFPLISGRMLPDGSYSQPISAIVANLNPPMNGKPSLLAHDDVETIFHEFGHIMHQTLTRAPYASLSGSSVAQDFVEAPSQMLENWVWSPEILNLISGHYLDHSKKLPEQMLQKMIEAQEFNQGYGYTKQLLYALFDMTLHTQDGPVDVNRVYLDLYQQILGQEPMLEQQFPASFGHLMGGYDAGYYGYLWSEVYAQDMFTLFDKNGLSNPEIGVRYRKTILEQGNMQEALDLLKNFLGRESSSEAFFKKLHI